MGGSGSEIAGSLVQDFWTAIEYGGVPEFLGRLRSRGHRLIARLPKVSSKISSPHLAM